MQVEAVGQVAEGVGITVRIADDDARGRAGAQLVNGLNVEFALQFPDGEELVEAVTDADLLDRDERLRVDVHDVIDDGSRIKGDLGLDLDGGHRRGDSSVGHHRVSPLQTEGLMDGDRSEEPSPGRQDDRDVDLGDRLTDRVRKSALKIDEGPVDVEGHHTRIECHVSQPATVR